MISIDDAREELIELRDELIDVGYEVDLKDDDKDHGVVLKVKLAGSVRMTVWCQDRDSRRVFRYGHPIHTPPLGEVDKLADVVGAAREAFGSP